MASCPGERGEKARKSFEKWRETHDAKVIKNLVGKDGFKRKQLVNTYKEGNGMPKGNDEKGVRRTVQTEIG